MKVKILGGYGSMLKGFGLTSFIIDGKILIDTGSAGFLTFAEQKKIEAIILTHYHIDHSVGLLLMADTVIGTNSDHLPIYTTEIVANGIREHLFNNKIWPDFLSIPNSDEPVMKLEIVQEEVPFKVGKYTITGVKVSHSVPTIGLIVSDGKTAFINTSDTGPTERLWEVAKGVKNLKAVLIETSFPNSLQNLADISGHLTANTLLGEIKKSGLGVPFYVYHIKAQFKRIVEREILGLRHPLIRLARQGLTYNF